MKIVGRIFIGILLLLLLVIGGVGFLLGTPSGLRWAIEQADGVIPGKLSIASVEGNLFGRLRLQQIAYRDDAMVVSVDDLLLVWHPAALFDGRFHLVELSLMMPEYTQLKAAEPGPETDTSSKSLSLADITLPIAVRIDKLLVENLRFLAEPDAKPVELNRLLLAVGWGADGIAIDTLEADMPGIAAAIEGKVLPIGSYSLDLTTRVSLALPDVPKLLAAGRIHGDLRKLLLEQNLSGDVQAAVAASASDPLGKLGWTANIELAALVLQSIAPEVAGKVAGKLSASGDLQRVQAEGQIRLEDAPAFYAPWHADLKLAADLEKLAVVIDQLVVTRPETPLELTLAGNADVDLNLDIEGRWKSLQWPPTGSAQVASESGALDLKGTAEDYRLTLQAGVAGTDFPAGQWDIVGRGSRDQFTIEKLVGKTLDGALGVEGKVTWAPAVTWDAKLSANAINPGVQYPDWPGKLDLVLSSKGKIENEVPQLSAVIDTLKGRLRERPIDGSGTVRVAGEEITLKSVKLASGAARLNADGRLGTNSDLVWELQVDDLMDVLPDAAGSLRGKGTVKGALMEPVIAADLSAGGLSYQTLAIESLAADLALDLSDKQVSKIDLQSKNLRFGEQRVPTLEVQAEGRKRDHRLSASLQHAMANLAVELAGDFNQAATSWKGVLSRLDIGSRSFGDWGLRKPVDIAAAPDEINLGELCLGRDGGSVCAQAALKNQKGKAQLEAQGLQLGWLQDFLPPEIERLDGAISARVDASLGDEVLANAIVNIEPGELVIHPPVEDVITLPFQGGGLDAKYDRKQLSGVFNLDIGEDGLKGRINAPRAALDKDPMTAPLDGTVQLRFRQLQSFAGLVPMVQKLNGELLVDLELGGKLGDPTIKGQAALDMPELQIPDAGLDLKEISFKAVSDDGRHMRLDGNVTSGGSLTLGGNLELNAARNWPMHITLKGDNFQVLDLPDKNARVNTDMALDSKPEGILLQGSLDIPQAYIVLDDLPQGVVTPSSDVVVETGDEEKEPDKGAPFAMRVTVGLGKDIKFRGFGLDAYFEGQLTVNQAPGEFPTGSGDFHIKEGTYKAYGQDLSIERGIVSYSGGRIDNPGLNVRAAREAQVNLGYGETSMTAGVHVTGTAKKPVISVFSDPAMEERDAISILLTGNTASNIGKGGGSVGLGTHVTKDLSVGVRFDPSSSNTEVVTKYRINRSFHVEATTSSESNGADIFYSLEFD